MCSFDMFKPPQGIFTDGSKAVLLLVIYVSCLSLLYYLVCSLQPCDHLLGNVWPLVFRCVFVTFPYGVSGGVWYLIVLIPVLCLFL